MNKTPPLLTWRQIITFNVVAHELSFSKAAEKLYLSQPAVSTQIRELESFYGVKLFDRLGRKVYLTQAGKTLFKYVQRMITISKEAEQALGEIKGLQQGRLAVGASLLVGSYMLPELLGEFRKRHVNVDIGLYIRYAYKVAQLVAENQVDLGFVGSSIEHPSLVSMPFLADELVVIVPNNHKWANRKAITPTEFCSEAAVFTEEGSSTRRVVLQQLSKHDLAPKITLELGHTEAVKRAVEVGLGISIISRHAIKAEIDTNRLKALALKGVDLRRHINLLHHKDKSPSHLTLAFLKLLQERWGCKLCLPQFTIYSM